jgi:putative oxidoreductase
MPKCYSFAQREWKRSWSPSGVPLIVIMLVALTTTKIPILLERGIWTMTHESRTDYSMLLGALFLLLAGGGPWAVDRGLKTRQ